MRPVHLPSVFSLPASFQRQSTGTPRDVESRKVNAESRRQCEELRNIVPDPDLIASWNDLEEYCDQLGVDVIKKEDRVLLCAISGNPPTVSF